MRVAAISAITSSTVRAVDSTAPVQVMSPTVRNRTVASKTGSSSPRLTYGESASSMPSRSNTLRVCAK